ncbi:VOC family protein [Timonella sp. A28]|uniref:VOC family protein n=1 Tax=Timonella sp. A28 TaxID=3442640 RepID=UPI003EBB5098
MTINLNAYISYRNEAREALTFYQSVLGGELTLTTYGEYPGIPGGGEDDAIMHGQLITEHGHVIMASDMPDDVTENAPSRIGMSFSGDDVDGLTGYFNGLSEGGNVIEPLADAPWGDRFGMFTDKFGIIWYVNILVSEKLDQEQLYSLLTRAMKAHARSSIAPPAR